MRSTVLGAGSWGTALASVLASKGFPVTLWGRDAAGARRRGEGATRTRTTCPASSCRPRSGPAPNLARALEGAELVVFAVPSSGMRQVAIEAKRHLHAGTAVVSAAKGIEEGSLMSMAEVLEDVLPVAMHPYLAYIGGPSFATEVVQQMPTAITVAGRWDRVDPVGAGRLPHPLVPPLHLQRHPRQRAGRRGEERHRHRRRHVRRARASAPTRAPRSSPAASPR